MKKFFLMVFLISSVVVNHSCRNNASTLKLKSQYKPTDVPEYIITSTPNKDSILTIYEYYGDTTIERTIAGKDSIGKYYFDLGYRYGKKGKHKQAIIDLKQALYYNYLPESTNGLIGNRFYALHMFDSSLKYLNKVLELNPNDEITKMQMEEVKQKLKK